MKSILNIIKGITFSVAVLAAVSSCMARKEYQRPDNVVDEKLYRTDMLPTDSTNIANVSWKEIFTDPVLQGHITKALENNLDIRIALQSISSAESYLKQINRKQNEKINPIRNCCDYSIIRCMRQPRSCNIYKYYM
jgi:hypothetical protein